MSYFKQDHTGTDNSATGMTQSRQAVEAEAGRPGPPQRRDNPVCPDDHSAVLRTLVTGPQNGIPQEQYLHSIDIANQRLGNRAFMHWVGALHATGQGGQAHAGSVQGRQDPAGSRTRSAPLQLMPKKGKQKEPAAEGQTSTAAETGAPVVPGAVSETAPGAAAQTVAEAAVKQTQAQAKEPAGPGDKRSRKKSRVQQALNALREKGVEAFERYIEDQIGETALLDTLTERVQRAEDLRGVMDAALGVIAARMGELDPEAVPMMPRALATVRREFAERPVAAPIKEELEPREEELVDCCFRNNAARFRKLLKFGRVNVNLATESGSLLFIAAIIGHTAIVKALLSMSGIDVNLAQEKGATPLFVAAQQGHVEIVRLLMNAPGINPGLGSFREGTSPLTVAALLGRVEVVKLLLSFRQVNINIRQNDGATPLFAAVQNDHPEVVELLISEGADVAIPLLIGTTPLARAAFQGSNEALKHLLRASGNNSNLTAEHKMSPLLFACQKGHKETVRLLLDYRADPNLADDAGVTPLHLACFLGHTEIAEMLLDAGADTEIAIENEYTPERVAMIGGHPALKMLLQARSGNRTGRTRAQFKSLSPCLQPPEPAPAEAGWQAPEEQTGATSPPVVPSVPSGTTVTLPAAQPGEAAPLPEPARESGTAGGKETSAATQKIAAPADSTIAGSGSWTPSTELNSPLARAKHEVRQDILMRLGNERLDHFNGIRLMEAVNLAADLNGLCGIHNRLAGIERKKLRNRRGRVRRPVSGAAAGAGLPDSGAAVFSLGDEQGLDADAIEGEIRKHVPQSRHRFISQVVNDMEFGRGKPTSGYPGLLHVSSGIAGVGSCSVFFHTDEEGQQIRIAGIGRHLDRETYRLDYAIEELGGNGRILRIA